MRDGRTRKLEKRQPGSGFGDYLRRWRATLVVVSGRASGSEYTLENEVTTLGRGPGVAITFEDAAMSRKHAAIEFAGEGFRVRDLGSMNGVSLNGSDVKVGDLKHGDRVQLGEHVVQFLLEERASEPRTYVLDES